MAGLGLCVAALASEKFTGTVSEDMCGSDHKHMGGTDPLKCTADCIKTMGAKYALVVGTDTYVLSDQKKAEKYVGKKVTVTGDLLTAAAGGATSKSLTVKSISPAK
jgi:3-hydroxy-3-methylglutaryl CoA synthase